VFWGILRCARDRIPLQAACDIYSLGVTLFEVATCVTPYDGVGVYRTAADFYSE